MHFTFSFFFGLFLPIQKNLKHFCGICKLIILYGKTILGSFFNLLALSEGTKSSVQNLQLSVLVCT